MPRPAFVATALAVLHLVIGTCPADQVVLAGGEQPPACIVVADEADMPQAAGGYATAGQAAEELQHWLWKAGGTQLQIVRASTAPAAGALLLVGRSALSEELGLKPPTDSEGVLIKSFPRGVAILGEVAPGGTNDVEHEHDRGTMHAVYEFLERCLGFRFYFAVRKDGPLGIWKAVDGDEDFGVCLPAGPTLAVETPVEIRTAPVFPHRTVGGGWEQRSAWRVGRGTMFYAEHTHTGWKYKFRQDHPEYFLLKADGTRNFEHLCYSEPGVLKQELANIEEFYETGEYKSWHHPSAKYIHVEPNDNTPQCQCEKCQAAYDDDRGRFGWLSNLWFGYVRDLALEVKKRWPGMRVATLAYQRHMLPPELDLPDNVDVMVCTLVPTNLYKEPEARAYNAKLMQDWSDKLGNDRSRLYVYDYPCLPNFFTAAPVVFPHMQQRWLQDMRGLMSGENLCNPAEGNTVQQAHFWLTCRMKLLWDPDMDVDAYLTDYCRHFFGPAAEPMESFYPLIIDRYENVEWAEESTAYDAGLHHGFFGETYTPEVIDQLEEYLNEAEVAARPVEESAREVGDGDWWVEPAPDRERTYSVELAGTGRAVADPTLAWGDHKLTYEGELHAGLRLVIQPAPEGRLKATLHATEMVPEQYHGKTLEASEGYHFATMWIRKYASPNLDYRVSMSGLVSEGGKALAVVYCSAERGLKYFAGDLGTVEKTVTVTVRPPEDCPAISYLGLYRKAGTVTCTEASVMPDLPAEGRDVTDRIAGALPTVVAGAATAFRFSGQGGASVRVSLIRPGGAGAEGGHEDLYHRRVLWMRKWCEDFNGAAGKYHLKTGFFPEARQAHKWIGRVPKYRVPTVGSAPTPSFDDPLWRDAPTTFLVSGSPGGTVPVDKFGFPADVPTRVRMLQDRDNVYVAFRCAQQALPSFGDSVSVHFYRDGDPVFAVTCRPDGSLEQGATLEYVEPVTTDLGAIGAATAVGGGWWAAFLTIPRRSLVPEGELTALRAHLFRGRGDRRYLWSPRIQGMWAAFPIERMGLVEFAGKL